MKTKCLTLLAALCGLFTPVDCAFAQGTAFTYQGKLSAGGVPANGSFDLQFTVLDGTNTPGNVISGPLMNPATGITNGLFTVSLDFGPGVFNGSARWLEIAVRTNGGAAFTTLSPRQPLTAAPYAILAGDVTSANVARLTPAGALAGTFSGNGGGLTNLNGAKIQPGTVPGDALDASSWQLATQQVRVVAGTNVTVQRDGLTYTVNATTAESGSDGTNSYARAFSAGALAAIDSAGTGTNVLVGMGSGNPAYDALWYWNASMNAYTNSRYLIYVNPDFGAWVMGTNKLDDDVIYAQGNLLATPTGTWGDAFGYSEVTFVTVFPGSVYGSSGFMWNGGIPWLSYDGVLKDTGWPAGTLASSGGSLYVMKAGKWQAALANDGSGASLQGMFLPMFPDKSMNQTALSKFWNTVAANNRPIRILTISDLGGFPDDWSFKRPLFSLLGANGGIGVRGVYPGPPPAGEPLLLGQLNNIVHTGTSVDYTYCFWDWGWSQMAALTNGSIEAWSGCAGSGIRATKARVIYLAYTNAGTFLVQTNTGAGWGTHTTVNSAAWGTNAAFITLSLVPGNYTMQIVGSTGTTRLIGAGLWDDTTTGVTYESLSIGGIQLSSINRFPTNYVWPLFKALDPDLIIINDQDSDDAMAGDMDPGYFAPWERMLTNCCTNASVLWMGNHHVDYLPGIYTFINGSERYNAQAITAALKYNQAYWDPDPVFGTNSTWLTELGLLLDNIHPATAARAYLNERLFKDLIATKAYAAPAASLVGRQTSPIITVTNAYLLGDLNATALSVTNTTGYRATLVISFCLTTQGDSVTATIGCRNLMTGESHAWGAVGGICEQTGEGRAEMSPGDVIQIIGGGTAGASGYRTITSAYTKY